MVFGHEAGFSNTSGSRNSFFGNDSGHANLTGINNSFFGNDSGKLNTSGRDNCFFGISSGENNISGGNNSFFGESSGLRNSEGTDNSFYGNASGNNNTTGRHNSYFGKSSGFLAQGSGNLILGRGAGPTSANSDINLRLFIDVDTSSSPGGNDEPLIYGEFDNDFVRINGTFEVTAGLSNPSSRDLKHEFVDLEATEILDKIGRIEVRQWSYKQRPGEIHVGPVAEDFYELFGLGEGNTKISTIDADGVMMLAIQALKDENEQLKAKLDEQEKLIAQILEKLE